jgi:transcriptional regulator of met regulon
MKHDEIDSIPVYPEHRLAEHPTTAKIFDRFHDLSLYRLTDGAKLTKQYQDELSNTHKKVLALLGMDEQQYWEKTC